MSARPGCPGLLGSPPNRAFPSAPPKARASPQRGAGEGGGGHRGVQLRVQTCLPPPPWRREWAATQDPEPGCSGLRRPQTNSLGHPACAQPSTSRAGDAAHSTRPPRLARGLRVWRRRGRGPGNGGAAVSPAARLCALRYRLSRGPGPPLRTAGLGRAPRPSLRLFLPRCAPAWALCHAQGGLRGQKGRGASRARAQSCGLSLGPTVTQTPPGRLMVGWSL